MKYLVIMLSALALSGCLTTGDTQSGGSTANTGGSTQKGYMCYAGKTGSGFVCAGSGSGPVPRALGSGCWCEKFFMGKSTGEKVPGTIIRQ